MFVSDVVCIPAKWSYHSSVPSQTFLTNASTAMWGSSEPEGVNVTLDLLQICVMTGKKKNRIHLVAGIHLQRYIVYATNTTDALEL